MHNLNIIRDKMSKRDYQFPLVVADEKMSWGTLRNVIRDSDGRYVGVIPVNGNSKQRRQQLKVAKKFLGIE